MLLNAMGVFSLILTTACTKIDYLDGQGGVRPYMTLPFPSGEYWNLTQGYETGSHQDYGFRYGNDSFALDFSQSGCNPYGKPITPILSGTVMKLEHADTDSDSGYGNSVLIQHEEGYVSRYGHMTGHNTSVGDHVDTQTIIGWVGDTGYTIGSACPDHPGTHLHLALYQGEEAVPPLPLSGTLMAVGCWYNREGKENCSGDPGPYNPLSESNPNDNYDDEESIEDDGDGLNVGFLDISPEDGSADHTEYVWVATVVSEHGKPDVTLKINNPNDGHTYDFEMSSESKESPWVFTYQKTLNDAATYTYWVEADVDGLSDESSKQQVGVDSSWDGDIDMIYSDVSPNQGEAAETEFEWELWASAEREPEFTLKIVNPNDATIYSFDMSSGEEEENVWSAAYEKTLNNSDTVYTWWIEAKADGSTQNTEVGSVETE